MLNSIFTSTSTNPIRARRDRDTQVILIGLFLALLVLAIATLSVGSTTGVWQYYVISSAAFLLGLIFLGSLPLIRRGENRTAAVLLLVGLTVSFLLTVSVTNGLGDLLTTLMIFLGMMFVTQLLVRRDIQRGIAGLIAAGLLIEFANIFLNFDVDLSDLRGTVAVVLAVVVAAYLVFLFSQLRDYYIIAKLTVTYMIVALVPII